MKKIISLITVLLLLTSGCAGKKNLQKVTTVLPFPEKEIIEVECFLGSGSKVTVTCQDVIREMKKQLDQVEVNLAKPETSLHIEDGDMTFIFKNGETTLITYGFCTSEYFYYQQKMYSVENPSAVRLLCELARNNAVVQ